MFCTNCGAQMPDGMRFCTNCGAPLRGSGPDAASDPTVVLPDPGPMPVGTEQGGMPPTDDGGYGVAPDGLGADGAPSGGEPPKGRRGLVIAAVVMGILAVLAVAAVVVVVIDPFGLHLLDGGKQQEQPAATEPAEEEDEKDAEPEEDPAPALESIAVETAPNKVEYLVGESLDASGLVLRLSYDDDSEQTLAYTADNAGDFAFDPTSFNSAGGFNITVTYGGLTATFGVTVSEAQPQSQPQSSPAPSSGGTFVLPDSATRLYSTDELSGLSDWDLYIARNEIYARHGRMFSKDDLQNYFNGQAWYTPLYSPEQFDSMGLLSSTEQQNAATILSIEQSRGSQYI